MAATPAEDLLDLSALAGREGAVLEQLEASAAASSAAARAAAAVPRGGGLTRTLLACGASLSSRSPTPRAVEGVAAVEPKVPWRPPSRASNSSPFGSRRRASSPGAAAWQGAAGRRAQSPYADEVPHSSAVDGYVLGGCVIVGGTGRASPSTPTRSPCRPGSSAAASPPRAAWSGPSGTKFEDDAVTAQSCMMHLGPFVILRGGVGTVQVEERLQARAEARDTAATVCKERLASLASNQKAWRRRQTKALQRRTGCDHHRQIAGHGEEVAGQAYAQATEIIEVQAPCVRRSWQHGNKASRIGRLDALVKARQFGIKCAAAVSRRRGLQTARERESEASAVGKRLHEEGLRLAAEVQTRETQTAIKAFSRYGVDGRGVLKLREVCAVLEDVGLLPDTTPGKAAVRRTLVNVARGAADGESEVEDGESECDVNAAGRHSDIKSAMVTAGRAMQQQLLRGVQVTRQGLHDLLGRVRARLKALRHRRHLEHFRQSDALGTGELDLPTILRLLGELGLHLEDDEQQCERFFEWLLNAVAGRSSPRSMLRKANSISLECSSPSPVCARTPSLVAAASTLGGDADATARRALTRSRSASRITPFPAPFLAAVGAPDAGHATPFGATPPPLPLAVAGGPNAGHATPCGATPLGAATGTDSLDAVAVGGATVARSQQLHRQLFQELGGRSFDVLDFDVIAEFLHILQQQRASEAHRGLAEGLRAKNIGLYLEFRHELLNLRQVFARCDEGLEGRLDENEIWVALNCLGLVPKRWHEKQIVLNIITSACVMGFAKRKAMRAACVSSSGVSSKRKNRRFSGLGALLALQGDEVIMPETPDAVGTANFQGFLNVLSKVRAWLQQSMRDELYPLFERCLRQRRGAGLDDALVGLREVCYALEDLRLGPENADDQQRIRHLLDNANEWGFTPLTLDFEAFVRFVRQVREWRASAERTRERSLACAEFGFRERLCNEYHVAFDLLDRTGQGQLDITGVRSLFRLFGRTVSTDTLREAFARADKQNVGSLRFVEVLALVWDLDAPKRRKAAAQEVQRLVVHTYEQRAGTGATAKRHHRREQADCEGFSSSDEGFSSDDSLPGRLSGFQ